MQIPNYNLFILISQAKLSFICCCVYLLLCLLSVRPHQVSHCVTTFDAVLRNNLFRFFMRCTSSSNFFIRSLQMSDVFYKSSFFLNYSTLLYGEKMQ